MTPIVPKIHNFYDQYEGHATEHLEKVHTVLRQYHPEGTKFIWFLGDSSLDNKYWITKRADPTNGYEIILPSAKLDVAYWMNKIAADRKIPYVTINTSIEATCLTQGFTDNAESRDKELLPQDQFVADHFRDGDILQVSVGGNDIALNPSKSTIAAMAWLIKGASDWTISNNWAFGMRHFIWLFKTKIENYLNRVIGDKKPSKVLVNMIYYPCISGEGWAEQTLNLMNYDTNHGRVHRLIRAAFKYATKRITLKNVPKENIMAVPMYKILDFEDENDYDNRVEPSEQGGMKLATKFLDAITAEDVSLTQNEDFFIYQDEAVI